MNDSTAILTINSFVIGWNEHDPKHIEYIKFLDRIFFNIKKENIQNLIIDIRNNGGGTDPNDLVTYSYLTDRNFMENKQAWVSFEKIPYLKYANLELPFFLKPLARRQYKKLIQENFPIHKNEGFFQDSLSSDHKIRIPNKNAFTGNLFLLISPRVASAGSLFAAMVAGNKNATVIGEETMGTYYGHNGHIPISYILPKSNIEMSFSIVNLEQDVPYKENQIYERGVMPDYFSHQSFEDFLNQKDTQLNDCLKLIGIE